MRVISGKYKGRALKALKGNQTRPTTDKVKESIFNMIGPYFDGEIVLDLYAGSGGLAIEAVSRGSSRAYCVDRSFEAVKVIRENIALTKEAEKFIIMKQDSQKALSSFVNDGQRFDLVFLDPPYAQEQIEQHLLFLEENKLLVNDALVVCEAAKEVVLPDELSGYTLYRKQLYGITQVVIYQKEAEDK